MDQTDCPITPVTEIKRLHWQNMFLSPDTYDFFPGGSVTPET